MTPPPDEPVAPVLVELIDRYLARRAAEPK